VEQLPTPTVHELEILKVLWEPAPRRPVGYVHLEPSDGESAY
jgi:hypothetical protein